MRQDYTQDSIKAIFLSMTKGYFQSVQDTFLSTFCSEDKAKNQEIEEFAQTLSKIFSLSLVLKNKDQFIELATRTIAVTMNNIDKKMITSPEMSDKELMELLRTSFHTMCETCAGHAMLQLGISANCNRPPVPAPVTP